VSPVCLCLCVLGVRPGFSSEVFFPSCSLSHDTVLDRGYGLDLTVINSLGLAWGLGIACRIPASCSSFLFFQVLPLPLCWGVWHVTEGEELRQAAELPSWLRGDVGELWARAGARQLCVCRCNFICAFAVRLANPCSPRDLGALLRFLEDQFVPAPVLPLAEPWLPLNVEGVTVGSVRSRGARNFPILLFRALVLSVLMEKRCTRPSSPMRGIMGGVKLQVLPRQGARRGAV